MKKKKKKKKTCSTTRLSQRVLGIREISVAMCLQIQTDINEHKGNSKNCLERDLNLRPRLSSADVLTTTPPRQPR